MSHIETECPCGASHAAAFDKEPSEAVSCDCGRVIKVQSRSRRLDRDGVARTVAQRLIVCRDPVAG